MRQKFLGLILIFSFVPFCRATEQVTITTYYPAPYGVYREMRANQMAVGSSYRGSHLNDGTLIVSDRLAIGTDSPSDSSALEISSASKGFLLPRMTTGQRDAIVNPALGLMIYNTVTGFPEFWNGTKWVSAAAFTLHQNDCYWTGEQCCVTGLRPKHVCNVGYYAAGISWACWNGDIACFQAYCCKP